VERDREDEPLLYDDTAERPTGEGSTGHRVAEALRRAVSVGMETLLTSEESLRGAVSDLKLPKEAVSAFLNQAERTKGDVTRALGRELRSFLESLDLRRIARKVLEGMVVEVHAEVRFKSTDALPDAMPEVKLVASTRTDAPAPRARPKSPAKPPRPRGRAKPRRS
jgi:hypothetical protein